MSPDAFMADKQDGQVEQQQQLLVCQLNTDATEEQLREAFAQCQASLAHVYLRCGEPVACVA